MSRRLPWILLALALLVALGLWWRDAGRTRTAPPVAAAPAVAPAPGDAVAPEPPRARPPVAAAEPEPRPEAGEGEDHDAMAEAWASVDMDEIRRALPDNLYWQMAVPTQDLREIDRRAEERARWNETFGRIQAGDASVQEIDDYYDYRARLSGDYVEFANYLLENYGDRLPERDVGLLELASRLHLARLEEIPRKRQEALARKQQQDEARARWRQEQAAFEDDDPSSR